MSQNKCSGYVIGLDVGTNSLGWSLLRFDKNNQPKQIIDSGVRIFQEAVEAKTRTPKNQARQAARSARKVIARRRQRKLKCRNLLIQGGWLPPMLKGHAQPEIIFNEIDRDVTPYGLRAAGLYKKLQPYEFGRVLMHLCMRRGFQSNRKSLLGDLADDYADFMQIAADDDVKPKDKEEGAVKVGIQSTKDAIQAGGYQSLGEYLDSIKLPQDHCRRIYTDRQMYKEEFELLWDKQAEYYPELKNQELKAALYDVVFWQRPLKSQKKLVGNCQFEPLRKKAIKARLEVQEFRVLQDVNNLAKKDPITGEWHDISPEKKQEVFMLLQQQKSMGWPKIRKLLNLHKGEKLNLEESKKQLTGCLTLIEVRGLVQQWWAKATAEQQNQLIEDLLTIQDKRTLCRRLAGHWGFSRREQFELATWEPEPGYSAQSLKAINKLLPFLRQGYKYHEARQAAGYEYGEADVRVMSHLPEPPYIRNPVVQKSLYEVRKVVNAIIREYGQPSVITIELAREIKLSEKARKALDKQNKINQKLNEDAARAYQEVTGGVYPSHNDKLKYRLWEECDYTCPYTLQPIPRDILFTDQIDIEHIFPYSRTLDNSYMNKTLCFSQENRLVKKNQTPYEAYTDKKNWSDIIQNARKHLPPVKLARFECKVLNGIDDFIARQLNDTRYISVEVKNYLKQLGCEIRVCKGGTTAMLRHYWGLNDLLGASNKKERGDHRHHAIDAIVIALTTRGLYQRLVRESQRREKLSPDDKLFDVPLPWPSFVQDVQSRLDGIVVSHAPARQLQGSLHELTAYGLTADGSYVTRKPIASLTNKMIANIIDDTVRSLVEKRLLEYGGDIKKAFANPILHIDGITPIRKVRVSTNYKPESVYAVQNQQGKPYKYLVYGNNHHVEIIENTKTGKREGRFVSMMEAARRARIDKQPIVQRDHGEGFRFIMSLCANDMVVVEEDSQAKYYRLQKMEATNNKLVFRLHTAATLNDNQSRLNKSVALFRGSKVTPTPLGKINKAHD